MWIKIFFICSKKSLIYTSGGGSQSFLHEASEPFNLENRGMDTNLFANIELLLNKKFQIRPEIFFNKPWDY